MNAAASQPGYSRARFRAWLETLDPDKPFCTDCNCPIAEYALRELGYWSFDNVAAESVDQQLATAIDIRCAARPGYRPGFDKWAHITPREVIELIDALEQRPAESEPRVLADVHRPWLA